MLLRHECEGSAKFKNVRGEFGAVAVAVVVAAAAAAVALVAVGPVGMIEMLDDDDDDDNSVKDSRFCVQPASGNDDVAAGAASESEKAQPTVFPPFPRDNSSSVSFSACEKDMERSRQMGRLPAASGEADGNPPPLFRLTSLSTADPAASSLCAFAQFSADKKGC